MLAAHVRYVVLPLEILVCKEVAHQTSCGEAKEADTRSFVGGLRVQLHVVQPDTAGEVCQQGGQVSGDVSEVHLAPDHPGQSGEVFTGQLHIPHRTTSRTQTCLVRTPCRWGRGRRPWYPKHVADVCHCGNLASTCGT